MSNSVPGQKILPSQAIDFSVPYVSSNAPAQFQVAAASVPLLVYNSEYQTAVLNPGSTVTLNFEVSVPIRVAFNLSLCSVDAQGIWSGPLTILVNGTTILDEFTLANNGFQTMNFIIPIDVVIAGSNSIAITAVAGSFPAIWFNAASVQQLDPVALSIDFTSETPTSSPNFTLTSSYGNAAYDPKTGVWKLPAGSYLTLALALPPAALVTGGIISIAAAGRGTDAAELGVVVNNIPLAQDANPAGDELEFVVNPSALIQNPGVSNTVVIGPSGNNPVQLTGVAMVPQNDAPVVAPTNIAVANVNDLVNNILIALGQSSVAVTDGVPAAAVPWTYEMLQIPAPQSPVDFFTSLAGMPGPMPENNWGRWSCFGFCMDLLTAMENTGTASSAVPITANNAESSILANFFPEGSLTYLNVDSSTLSSLNHGFLVYVTGGNAYLTQIWVDQQVPFVQEFPVADLVANLITLFNNNWQVNFPALFGNVPPNSPIQEINLVLKITSFLQPANAPTVV